MLRAMTDLAAEFSACLDPLDERQSVARLTKLGVPTSVKYREDVWHVIPGDGQ